MCTRQCHEEVCKAIRRVGLSGSRWGDTGRVGVHPANRDFAGLVPVDVLDLLLRVAANGWCWEEVEALACEIPPIGKEGNEWRAYNVKLAATSDGLLAPVNGSLLETVADTHLRAHETVLELECRLLMEKKNKIPRHRQARTIADANATSIV